MRLSKPLSGAAVLALASLVACGGGGGGSSSSSKTPSFAYTAPTPNAGQPVIQLNTSLTSSTVVVFDVVGTTATATRGIDMNLTVDNSKLLPIAVPGAASPTVRPVVGVGIDTGGFGGGQAVAVRSDRASDGLTHMVTAIRYPAPAVPSNQVLMRFAYQLNGSPVEGVIRAQVGSGGLLDTTGKVIPGTSPAMGRLEVNYH